MRIRCPECGKLNNVNEPFKVGTIYKCDNCKDNYLTLIIIVSKMIINDLGQLRDIPKELANTVANIYYKFITYFNHYSTPSALILKLGNRTELRKFIDDIAIVITNFETIIEAIKGLRSIDKSVKPNLYQYAVEYILDNYKYNIRYTNYKPGIWRMIERKFKKVNEISNLIDFLVDVYPS